MRVEDPVLVVERGHIATFARALGETSPIYYDLDVARAAGFPDVPTPPTFVEAVHHFDPDFAFAPRSGRPWFGSGRTASGAPRPLLPTSHVGGSDVHAETHFCYRSPWLCAGERIHQRERWGRTWSRVGRRGGALTFFEVIRDFEDEAGVTRVTARTVGVSTERPVAVDQAGVAVADVVEPAALVPIEEPVTLVEDLSRAQIVQYAGASGDFAPYHTDEIWCTEVGGYPTVFAHGMLTMGMTARALPPGWGGRLRRYGSRFTGQVWPGDDLSVLVLAGGGGPDGGGGDPDDIREGRLVTVNQRGEVVLDTYVAGA